jgi:hypothetical protein
MNHFSYVSAMAQVYNENKDDINHTINSREAVGICTGVNCAVIAAQIAADVAIAILTCGMNAAAYISAALGTVALGFMIACTVIEKDLVDDMKKGRDL